MTLPASLLQHAEQHPCFSGCYSSEPNVSVCLDPNHPPAAVVAVSCQDCFARMGAPVALLPPGSNSHTLAAALSQHVRARRGYAVSVTEAGVEGSLRVRLGNFSMRDDAERQLRNFKQQGMSGIIINLPQAFRPEARSSVP